MKHKIDEDIRNHIRSNFLKRCNYLLKCLDSDDMFLNLKAANEMKMLLSVSTMSDEWSSLSMNTGLIVAQMPEAEENNWTFDGAQHPLVDKIEDSESVNKEYLK